MNLGIIALLSAYQRYELITKDLNRSLKGVASQAVVKRESSYYLENIGKVKSIDEFVSNQRLFSFAMQAFGMSDLTYAKALVKKALVEGIDNERSFANRMVDPRLREFVGVFNFARRGEFTTGFDEVRQGTVDKYVRQTLEADAGRLNEGVRKALYFQRKAPSLTNAYSILSDRILLDVTYTALGLPAQTSSQDLEKQAALIAKKLDVSGLKEPAKLKQFLEKFLSRYELTNPSASSVTAPVFSNGLNTSISAATLASIQNLKLRGGV